MALVVLTEPKPLEAIAAVVRRCAYFTIPLSIVFIRYFRDIGVSWDWEGSAVNWIGIATSKNTLGQVAVTSALYFIWERMRRQGKSQGRMIDFLYIVMSLYLLKGSDQAVSMTSLSVFAVGLFVFLRLRFLNLRPHAVKTFCLLSCAVILGVLLTVIWHTLDPFSENSFMGVIIRTIGRDMTLTGRTEIWADVFNVASRSPVLGVGYGAFWIGRLANIPWNENMTWVLGQGHNGYVDIYLQLGWVGVGLFTAVILSSIRKITRSFPIDFEYGRFRMTFFLVILFVNITESILLRGDHNMWFLFLLAALSVPYTSEGNSGLPEKIGTGH
jgi:O-antigen ligase